MKRIFFTSIAVVSIIVTHAQTQPQTEKGSIMLGSNIASGVALGFGETIFNLQLNPKAGYFIKDNFVIGAGVEMGVFVTPHVTSLNYGILPFARYYFKSKTRSQVFAEVDLGFSHTKTTRSDPGVITPANMYIGTVSIAPGYTYHVTQNISLEVMYRLRLSRFGSNNNFNTSIIPTLNIGFQIYLSNKKHDK